MASSFLERKRTSVSTTDVRLTDVTMEQKTESKFMDKDRKKKVMFKNDFVETIDVECWKDYNCDCSENPSQWDKPQDQKTKKEEVYCSCSVF